MPVKLNLFSKSLSSLIFKLFKSSLNLAMFCHPIAWFLSSQALYHLKSTYPLFLIHLLLVHTVILFLVGIKYKNLKSILDIHFFVAGCQSFCLFFIFYNIHTFIQSHSYNTFIHRHLLRHLSISSSLVCSVGNTSLWCPAENRIGLPYSKPTHCIKT
jgi:hypothetical protein